jgi:hypothetical protein
LLVLENVVNCCLIHFREYPLWRGFANIMGAPRH